MKHIARLTAGAALSMLPLTAITSIFYTSLLSDDTMSNYHKTLDTVHATTEQYRDIVDLTPLSDLIDDYTDVIEDILKTVE